MKPRTRAEHELRNRQFSEWFLLPFIGQAVKCAGLKGDDALSAAASEIETIRELRHLFKPVRAARRPR